MATLRKQEAEWKWPPELVTFDPQRWECRAARHLARTHAAPSKRLRCNRFGPALGTPGAADRGEVVIVGPPAG